MPGMHTATQRLTTAARLLLLAMAVVVASLTAPALAAAEAPSAPSADVVPDRILVKWAAGTPERAKDEGRAAAGTEKIKEIEQLGVDVLKVPAHARDRALAGLQRNPHVVYAESDRAVQLDEVTPNDPYWSRQWSPVKTRATLAWDLTTGSASTVVAVLDTGVSSSHVELQGQLVPGRNVIAGNSNTEDDHGHGTQSAGVVAALTNNATGVASYCWKCKVMPVKVMSSAGTGYMSDLAAGITWASDNGADVISMSLSGSSGTTTLANAVKYASDRGVVLAAAAGNDGTSTPRYPAAYPEVIGVAGTDSTDTLYSWSNYGSWVDVSAPGSNMTTNYTGGYASYAGTSSATPVVAGLAGLAFSYNPSATGAAVRSAIESTAVAVSGVKHGRIDTYATLTAVGASAPAPEPTPEPTSEPTAEPTAEPSPDPEPTAPAEPMTSTFSGTLNGKNATRSHSLTAGSGDHVAAAQLSKAGPASLKVYDSTGRQVAATTGDKQLALTVTLSAGTYTYELMGPSKASYTLTVTHAAP